MPHQKRLTKKNAVQFMPKACGSTNWVEGTKSVKAVPKKKPAMTML
jgi:hypothetical protein